MNEFFSQIYPRKMTSELLIKSIDEFWKTLTQKTVLVMERASFHTSDAAVEKMEEWKAKNLEIFWLPAYSPKLNLIEIL